MGHGFRSGRCPFPAPPFSIALFVFVSFFHSPSHILRENGHEVPVLEDHIGHSSPLMLRQNGRYPPSPPVFGQLGRMACYLVFTRTNGGEFAFNTRSSRGLATIDLFSGFASLAGSWAGQIIWDAVRRTAAEITPWLGGTFDTVGLHLLEQVWLVVRGETETSNNNVSSSLFLSMTGLVRPPVYYRQ